AGTTELQRTYLRMCGPASDADVVSFLGTSRTAVGRDRPGNRVAVRVDGRTAYSSREQVEAISRAAGPDSVRLLPPSDPWLSARDREVVVPDAAHRRRIWVSIGAPGVVLAGVDVVGLWRTRQKGRTLRVETEWFGAPVDVGAEAARLAVVRGAGDVTVV
ncbi:MAG: winged helix DNA-binding domain-containing protein, partial [Pseudonocardia sp.]|nr:winged helix DNA-binding domain-containing protein [Pseudonocardia sp.]